jgi:ribosomal protein S18 acetylase RimI-like enzyme
VAQDKRKKMNALIHKENIVDLPEGFTARGATMNDIEPSMELINRWSRAVLGWDESISVEGVQREWTSPDFDPVEDIRLVFAPNGEMAGYIEVWTTGKPPVHPWIWGRVGPNYEGMGIGTWMLQWSQERALRVLPTIAPELRFAPRIGIWRPAEQSKKLFEDFGYHYYRSNYHMLIEMDAPVPAPEFPAGITLRAFNPETDAEAVYLADVDAFRDHFGFVDVPFEEGFKRFKHFMIDYEDFDPSLWFLAMDGDEIAGICLCRSHSYEDPDMSWVSDLGVRRPWRKRGIGLALLRHSFNELYRRGRSKIGLGVDAQNLTGALRLYEGAGMHIHRAFDNYEKEMRPGVEITLQSLAQEP